MNAMNIDTASVEALEPHLAALTKPRPCTGEFLCGECWVATRRVCNGSGVVPLVAKWRRDCDTCHGRGYIEYGDEEPVENCDNCHGLGYVPDIGMEKLMAWMTAQIQGQSIMCSETGPTDKTKRIQWFRILRETISTDGETYYEALLRACAKGLEAMEANDGS